ncbi:hypothetical protein ACQEWB_00050 [Streptomyces sp. CA-249302]
MTVEEEAQPPVASVPWGRGVLRRSGGHVDSYGHEGVVSVPGRAA